MIPFERILANSESLRLLDDALLCDHDDKMALLKASDWHDAGDTLPLRQTYKIDNCFAASSGCRVGNLVNLQLIDLALGRKYHKVRMSGGYEKERYLIFTAS